MSNEIKKVEKTANETEKRVKISGREWDEYQELKESNKNLIAEGKQLQDKIGELESKIKRQDEDSTRVFGWYKREQDKVRALKIIIAAMKSDYVSIDTIVERITEAV